MKKKSKKNNSDFIKKFYNFDDIYYDYPELYYENGKLISHEHFKHPKNGIVKIFTSKGNLFLEISYKNNKKQGKCVHYHFDKDKVKLIAFYRNNKLHGKTTSYDTMGNLILEEYFYDGVKEGIERRYSKKGLYLEETRFENNKKQTKASYKKIQFNKINLFMGKLRKIFNFQ